MAYLTKVSERTTVIIPFGSPLHSEYEFPLLMQYEPWCTQYVSNTKPLILKSLIIRTNLMLFDVDTGDRITHHFWLSSRFIVYDKNHGRDKKKLIDVSGNSLLGCEFLLDIPLSIESKNQLDIRLLNPFSNFTSAAFNIQKAIIPKHLLDGYYISLELFFDIPRTDPQI